MFQKSKIICKINVFPLRNQIKMLKNEKRRKELLKISIIGHQWMIMFEFEDEEK